MLIRGQRYHIRNLLLASSLLGLTVACGGGPSEGPPVGVPVNLAVQEETLSLADDMQAFAAADEVLTFSEYEMLVNAFAQCVREAGSDLAEFRLLPTDVYYVVVNTPPEASVQRVQECEATYWEPLAALWSQFHQPTAEDLHAADDTLRRCLEGAGVPYAEASNPEHLTDRAACSRRVLEMHGIPNFGGLGD